MVTRAALGLKRARAAVQTVGQGLPPEQPVSWLELLLLAQAWFLVMAPTFVGGFFSFEFALYYVLLTLIPLVRDRTMADQLFRQPLREYIVKFLLGFWLTVLAFWVLFLEVLDWRPQPLPYETLWAIVLFQVVFVTTAEEIFFRAYLPRRIDPKRRTMRLYGTITVGSVLSAAVFSSFHVSAYGFDSLTPYLIVGALAVIWTAASQFQAGWLHEDGVKRPVGVALTIGSHLAWNLCVLGVLTGGVVVGGV